MIKQTELEQLRNINQVRKNSLQIKLQQIATKIDQCKSKLKNKNTDLVNQFNLEQQIKQTAFTKTYRSKVSELQIKKVHHQIEKCKLAITEIQEEIQQLGAELQTHQKEYDDVQALMNKCNIKEEKYKELEKFIKSGAKLK